MNSILNRANYHNKDIKLLKNVKIYEYDMKDAGFSVIKELRLLDEATISLLSTCSKHERNVIIGKMRQKDLDLSKKISEGLLIFKQQFFEQNNLVLDDILSIKNDAIFIINKVCKITKITDNIEIRIKNRYTSYLYINNIELYYESLKGKIDVKGVSSINIEFYKDSFLLFFKKFFKIIETEGYGSDTLFIFLKNFKIDYCEGKLPTNYYYEFCMNPRLVLSDDISKSEFNTNYNLMNVILPLFNLCF